jgi:nicotinamidase-related amidase
MSSTSFIQSNEMMSMADTFLAVVDVQERLLPAIAGRNRLVWNIGRLVRGARLLEVRGCITEQYPKGLGPTDTLVKECGEEAFEVIEKQAFSCCLAPRFLDRLQESGCRKVLLCGIESHVCVQQTALDLISEGYQVYIAADGVGSRNPDDLRWALSRMEASGATIVTTEAVLFEWLRTSDDPRFREISKMVRETPPFV